jgi:hypothetical protein
LRLVGGEGFEPSWVAPADFKSAASAVPPTALFTNRQATRLFRRTHGFVCGNMVSRRAADVNAFGRACIRGIGALFSTWEGSV